MKYSSHRINRTVAACCSLWILLGLATATAAATVRIGPEATPMERTAAGLLLEAGNLLPDSRLISNGADPEPGDILLGTPASSPLVASLSDELDLETLGDEGFVVTTVRRGGTSFHLVAAAGPRGVLYGSAALLEQLRRGTPVGTVELRESPRLAQRCLWAWNGPRRSSSALFNIDRMANVQNEPALRELGRYLARARINTLMLWPNHRVRPDAGEGVEETRETYRRFCRHFRENYGVDVYLFTVYEFHRGTPTPIHGYPICPFDERVRAYWREYAKNFNAVGELRGAIIAGAGGDWVRGPWECQCDRCRKHTDRELLIEAMKMIGRPLAEHGGRIIWKAVTDRPTRVRSEVEHFANLDDQLPPYVTIAHKDFYKDFRQPHPIHPMFYAHEDNPGHQRPYLCEFQIYGEYRGGTDFPCVMIDRWAEVFPLLTKKHYAGAIAVASFDRFDRWDHPLNLANWYAFGRLAWNPDESPDAIYRDWAALNFGEQAADAVVDICRTTYEASTKMMFFRGVMTQNHSKLPTIDWELESSLVGPWHDIPKAPDGYWGRAHDVSAYPPDVAAEIRNDPDLLLWAHRVPITPKLCDEAIAEKKEALDLVRQMTARWNSLPHEGWEQVHAEVARQFERNVVDAEAWYLTTKIYFDYKAGRLTKSDLRQRIADIRARIDPSDGSGLLKSFENCLEEWTRVAEGQTKRFSMPGAHRNPDGEDFLPGLKPE